jgi:hypothetical protein
LRPEAGPGSPVKTRSLINARPNSLALGGRILFLPFSSAASAYLYLSFSLRPPENAWKAAAAAPRSTWRRLRQRFRRRLPRWQRRPRAPARRRQRGRTSCTGSGPSGTTSSRSPSPAPRGAPRSRRPTPSTPSRSSGGICAAAFGTLPPGFLPDPFGSDMDAVLRPLFST